MAEGDAPLLRELDGMARNALKTQVWNTFLFLLGVWVGSSCAVCRALGRACYFGGVVLPPLVFLLPLSLL